MLGLNSVGQCPTYRKVVQRHIKEATTLEKFKGGQQPRRMLNEFTGRLRLARIGLI
jgi:hypothetical protein